MRLGILSDTHNQIDRTRRAIDLLTGHGAEAFIHCGDITQPPVLELLPAPTYFVLGNNDDDALAELGAAASATGAVCLNWGGIIELAGKRIAITHGHLSSEVRPLLSRQPDYLLSGHSHLRCDVRVGATRRINPGALHRTRTCTVALLDLCTDELQFCEVASRHFPGAAGTT